MNTNPDAYPRRVLLAVTGLSPQIVTETLYGLAVLRQPPFVPTELRLITTATGAEQARLSLLSEKPGWFHRLRADYGLPSIQFSAADIEVIRDAAGEPLADIRHPDDNAHVADRITETVRTLTADSKCALHVSIAGGRKTMGYYAGYALSLFGRPQDRLSHVLVSAPFESSREFFYPTPDTSVIQFGKNRYADSKDAQVTLAEIPFVRQRDGLPERLLKGEASFGDTIAAAQRAMLPPALTIDLAGERISAAGETIALPPAALAFYAMMARRCKEGLDPARWNTVGIDHDYLAQYRCITGEFSGDLERVEDALRDGMTQDDFDQRRSRTNRQLNDALGRQLAAPYLIQADGRRPNTRYGLRLDPEAIRFGALDDDRDNDEQQQEGDPQ